MKFKQFGFWAGVLAGAAIAAIPLPSLAYPARATMGAAVLMAVWWMTEALPLAATALVPLVLFPALQIVPVTEVARNYGDATVFLFLGGFVLAAGVERWNLHRRVALQVLLLARGRLAWTLLGFLGATAFLSMLVSNTATALMMLPIALSVSGVARERLPEAEGRSFTTMLLLAVAYGASIGGMATLIGSPPNAIFAGFLPRTYGPEASVSFLQWMLVGVPLMLLLLPTAWAVLLAFGGDVSFLRRRPRLDVAAPLREEVRSLGPLTRQEKIVMAVAACTVFLWVFREPLDLGAFRLPGWSGLLPNPRMVGDASVAVLAALALFILKSGGSPLLRWKEAEAKIPWGVLILFGGGFALADAFQKSGLAGWFGTQAEALTTLPPVLTVFGMALMMNFLTELTSNTAVTATLLPVFAALVPAGTEPALYLMPVTLAASCAFMLPVATPPNAVVFASGHLTVARMVRTGVLLNVVSTALITLLAFTIVPLVF